MSGDVAAPVRLPRDAAYLREHYLQWLRCRSRQRWPMLASLLLALAGAASLLWQPSARPLLAGPVALLALAAALLWLMPVFEFRRWKRAAQGGLPAMPDLVLETRRSREVLAAPYPLADVVAQTTALALFLTGLARNDLALIREGLRDVLVEPRRAPLIPGFDQVRQAALDHGALGASISGGGPSLFGWFASRAEAEAGAAAMRQAFADAGQDATSHVTAVNAAAAALL